MTNFKNVLATGTLAAFAFIVPAMSAAQLTSAESVNQNLAATFVLADNGSGNNGAASGTSGSNAH